MLPTHIASILAGKFKPVHVHAPTQARDKRPVFQPMQGGSSPRALSAVIDDMEELEAHDDMPMIDNTDPDLFCFVPMD